MGDFAIAGWEAAIVLVCLSVCLQHARASYHAATDRRGPSNIVRACNTRNERHEQCPVPQSSLVLVLAYACARAVSRSWEVVVGLTASQSKQRMNRMGVVLTHCLRMCIRACILLVCLDGRRLMLITHGRLELSVMKSGASADTLGNTGPHWKQLACVVAPILTPSSFVTTTKSCDS